MTNIALADISKHLTEEVINKAFQRRTCSQDTVKNIEVKRGAAAGEGLLSAVYRIYVTGYEHSASFIVKGSAPDPLTRNTLNSNKFFKREVDFFTNVLPVINDVQSLLGGKERISRHIPVCYSLFYDGLDNYILLEDLSESQCRSVSITPSTDEKNQVLKSLAHFHAVSMALRLKWPKKFTETINYLPELYFNEENRDWYSNYLQSAIDVDRRVMAEFEDTDSIYCKKFNDILGKDMYGTYIAAINRKSKHAVICHGDAWSPNFLYSQERMVIIDFQLVRSASMVTDLTYWLLLCCNNSTLKQDFFDAIDVYYSAFDYYLNDMGIDASNVFTRAMLDEELKLHGVFGYLAALGTLPLLSSINYDGSIALSEKFPGVDRIPLEHLWKITPMEKKEHKLRLWKAVRMAVDVGLI